MSAFRCSRMIRFSLLLLSLIWLWIPFTAGFQFPLPGSRLTASPYFSVFVASGSSTTDGLYNASTTQVSSSRFCVTDNTRKRVIYIDEIQRRLRAIHLTNLSVTTLYVGVDSQFSGSNSWAALAVAPSSGLIFTTDFGGQVVRQFNPFTGVLTLIAGSGSPSTIDGIGTAATFSNPYGCHVSEDETFLYLVEFSGCVLRRVDLSTKAVKVMAGTAGSCSFGNGIGTAARFSSPRYISFGVVDKRYYITENGNNDIRVYNTTDNSVATYAGTPPTSGSIDGFRLNARISSPAGITHMANGVDLFFFERGTCSVRAIISGFVFTIAGGGCTSSIPNWGRQAKFLAAYGLCRGLSDDVLFVHESIISWSGLRDWRGGTKTMEPKPPRTDSLSLTTSLSTTISMSHQSSSWSLSAFTYSATASKTSSLSFSRGTPTKTIFVSHTPQPTPTPTKSQPTGSPTSTLTILGSSTESAVETWTEVLSVSRSFSARTISRTESNPSRTFSLSMATVSQSISKYARPRVKVSRTTFPQAALTGKETDSAAGNSTTPSTSITNNGNGTNLRDRTLTFTPLGVRFTVQAVEDLYSCIVVRTVNSAARFGFDYHRSTLWIPSALSYAKVAPPPTTQGVFGDPIADGSRIVVEFPIVPKYYSLDEETIAFIFLDSCFTPTPARSVDPVQIVLTPPQRVPIAAAVVASATAVVSAGAVVSVSGASATQAARSQLLLALSSCSFDVTQPLGWSSYPIGYPLTDDKTKNYVGALVLNPALMVGIALVHFFFTMIVGNRMHLANWREAFAFCRFPALSLIPPMFLLQDSIGAVITVLWRSKHEVALTLAILFGLLWTVFLVGICWFMIYRFGAKFLTDAEAEREEIKQERRKEKGKERRRRDWLEASSTDGSSSGSEQEKDKSKKSGKIEKDPKVMNLESEPTGVKDGTSLKPLLKPFKWFFFGNGDFIDDDRKDSTNTGYCHRYATLFDPYKVNRRGFFVVEVLMTIGMAAINAVQPEDGDCTSLNLAMCILLFLYTFLVITVRPYFVPFNMVFFAGLSLTQSIASLLSVLSDRGYDQLDQPSAILTVFCMYAGGIKSGADLVVTLLDWFLSIRISTARAKKKRTAASSEHPQVAEVASPEKSIATSPLLDGSKFTLSTKTEKGRVNTGLLDVPLLRSNSELPKGGQGQGQVRGRRLTAIEMQSLFDSDDEIRFKNRRKHGSAVAEDEGDIPLDSRVEPGSWFHSKEAYRQAQGTVRRPTADVSQPVAINPVDSRINFGGARNFLSESQHRSRSLSKDVHSHEERNTAPSQRRYASSRRRDHYPRRSRRNNNHSDSDSYDADY
jgi:hypothetical protein